MGFSWGEECENTANKPIICRAMAQAVSRRPLTAETWVRSRVSPCGFCGGQSGTGTGFSPEYFGRACLYAFCAKVYKSMYNKNVVPIKCLSVWMHVLSPKLIKRM
jgi:hypothetical protein